MNQTVQKTTESKVDAGRVRDERLSFYHPAGNGGGSALQLEPRFNRREQDRYNCFFLELAPQKTVASREGDKRVHATFDWERKLTVKLDFADICELLTVLEGRAERMGGSRNGLFHQNGANSTVISFQKAEKGGYFLSLSRKQGTAGDVQRVQIVLNEPEAIGLRCVFQTSLFFLTFHTQLLSGTLDTGAAHG